jgi:O-antigen/teichoic acid export membrane protein
LSDNSKIAKNSLILYVKLIFTTFVGLYTSRIVLHELGAEGFGLYAVVGGVVSLMGFLSTTLASTTYRFVAVEMGKGNYDKVNKIFNSSLTIFIIIGFLMVAIGEIVGVWYVKNHLNIEAFKVRDALFVLHFVIANTFISVIAIPYQGLITAHENFLVRVSIEILKAVLKLGLVFLLIYYVGNKLRAYALIMMIVSLLSTLLFVIYCRRKYFKDVRWKISRDISIYKEMLGFSGWMIYGAFARVAEKQGGVIIINLFFGTVVNAAFGIASQVYSYTIMFVHNISQAAVPQIMKSQGAGNSVRTVSLLHSINKYSYFTLICITSPIILSIDPILEIWLTDVPQYTKQFAVLMIANGLISVTGTGFGSTIQATGKIRVNQIISSFFILLTLPLAYTFFNFGYPPYFITVAIIGISVILRMVRAWILSSLIKEFVLKNDFKEVLMPIAFVTIAVLPQFHLRLYFGNTPYDVIVFSMISIVMTLMAIYFLGLNGNERKTIIKHISINSKYLIEKMKKS